MDPPPLAAVPLPAAAWLFGSGLLGLIASPGAAEPIFGASLEPLRERRVATAHASARHSLIGLP
jgi:hypothetical protein